MTATGRQSQFKTIVKQDELDQIADFDYWRILTEGPTRRPSCPTASCCVDISYIAVGLRRHCDDLPALIFVRDRSCVYTPVLVDTAELYGLSLFQE